MQRFHPSLLGLVLLTAPAFAEPVANVSDLRAKIQSAAPGTGITLAEGRFELEGHWSFLRV